MIDLLIHLLVLIVIAGIIFWLVQYLLSIIPMDARLKQVAYVLLAVIFVLVLLQQLLPLLNTGHTL